MTTLSGTLNINARGAQLHCSLGCFIIRDEQLTHIASGKYRGFFDIQKILPHAITTAHGQLQLVLLAVVKQFALDTSASSAKKIDWSDHAKWQQQLSLFDETDRLDEILPTDSAHTHLSTLPAPMNNSEESDKEPADNAVNSEVTQHTISTSAIAVSDLPRVVALDPTLTREQLRREVRYLQTSGYTFDAQQQVWELAV